jgi:predicted transcriptional regulator
MEKTKRNRTKNEFLRLRIDKIEKGRLDKLCSITRRQKSDIIRESLFDYFKSKYPECLAID